ncbi:glycosyltransferase family 4 protein [Haloarcula salina]|uniref:Glycosyltransferase family 4 protein n=1 Tax=Haloarcula salina TaxID=1429914 RepID=A0AA41KCY8_9EURY|nr:glycosyltransferase family 4 protein [Haloarcula salina]MBV0902980.1 glycosyltransferase family 4 protein [Haloarcula salina]
MRSVAVVHKDLSAKGGAEAVAVNVLEALQPQYDVTLLTLQAPDVASLNAYYDADVDADALTVRRAGRVASAINDRFGLRYYLLQNALLGRLARRHADEFDLVISTLNELGLGAGSIQYVHFPFDWNAALSDRDDIFHDSVPADSLYQRLCSAIADVDERELAASVLLANSEWTAGKFTEAYGTRPEVLYPPVDTRGFTDRPWAERENGFVTIGRVERSKRTLELIGVMDALRDRGHDVHLHVVGPAAKEAYARRLADVAADRPYIEVEGELQRAELVDLICTHRYGIHGKEYEHFGMAVAELAAGGTVPFVPATGGQRAIVGERDPLLYDSLADCVDRINRVLADPEMQRELQMDPAEIERQFGRERFRTAIRATVADAIGDGGDDGDDADDDLPEPTVRRPASASADD